MTPLLHLSGLTKAYPGVIANDDVGFEIQPGEVHALLGENGAGKSTLVKMIYGLVRPDSGEMRLHDQPFTPSEPREARASGVAMVFQHFSLFEALTVAENISLGMENPPENAALSAQITEVSANYGLTLDPNRRVGDLSAGERQRVEIVRCLLQNPKLLIMDEPTSVLTPQEVDILFQTLRKLRDEGTSILYISHKLEEIRTICDNATILRLGKVVGTCVPSEETPKTMAEMMVGTELKTPSKRPYTPGPSLLDVNDMWLQSADPFGTSLRDITFSLHAGEVLGVAGVAGNGQDELLLALSGEERVSPDAIKLKGENIGNIGPNQRRQLGLLAAPEERLGHAAAPDMSLTENALLTGHTRQRLTNKGFVKWQATRNFARAIIEKFDVRTPGTENAAKSLSGGNLQKFVIGREIMQRPDVLVVNQPTWGVDASAAAFIREAILELAEQGAGVLVISQDLDELMEISDTFAVLSEGRLSRVRSAAGVTIEEIGLLMGGTEVDHAAA
ncbi:ABC transporter ATP-binding protein [Amylibacter sp. IMCC11727]|uniref:ABC transporter ATP-binding protein n=1 Tax=Amylibacter sp. IMCC11727 TaxID=3039851 RepID=UPI00244DF1EA|nr:ABC transporter ATP-binding protein [Amylibacter sp. IMCC11727]WGI21370.1 ABC transporter ATP-binding protein [Amylibacter sp. IMCC11727]